MTKVSLREEIENIKKESEVILSSKDLSPESKFFIKNMLSIIQIMVVIFLEKKTRKNSSNSGLPPSHQFESNGNRNKSKSETKKQRVSFLENSKVEMRKEVFSPQNCKRCGSDLEGSKVTGKESREVMDLEYTVIRKVFYAETRRCLDCGEKTKAHFPEAVESRFQYGLGIKAGIINFLAVEMMSFNRVAKHFKGILGRLISEATMLKSLILLGEKLKDWEQKVKDDLLKAPVIYVDETSMRVNKKNHWIHTASYGDSVLQTIHPKRGVEGIKDMGLLDDYGGIIVHDCWSSYFTFENVKHGLCCVHLMREFKFIEESQNDSWATRMKEFLKEAVIMVNSTKTKVLKKKQAKDVRKKI